VRTGSARDGTLVAMEQTPIVAEPAAADVLEDSGGVEAQLLEDELLIEEISIDGMCGVY
jgi:mycofactocin precursor